MTASTSLVNDLRMHDIKQHGVDRHRFKVQLQGGKNTVLVKVCQSAAPNPEPNWEFFLRVVDATGKGIAFTSSLPGDGK